MKENSKLIFFALFSVLFHFFVFTFHFSVFTSIKTLTVAPLPQSDERWEAVATLTQSDVQRAVG